MRILGFFTGEPGEDGANDRGEPKREADIGQDVEIGLGEGEAIFFHNKRVTFHWGKPVVASELD